MKMVTFEELEQIAIGAPWSEQRDMTLIVGEPLLRTTLTAIEMGLCTREQGLIQLVVTLIELKNRQYALLLEQLNTRPFAPLVIPRQDS